MQNFLFFSGVLLTSAGIAFFSWKFALICLGLFLVFVAVRIGGPAEPKQEAVPMEQTFSHSQIIQ